MKRLLAFIILLIAAVTMSAQASVINQNMTHDGSKVTVTFEVDTDKSDIPSQRKEVILPYIFNGKDTLYLDPLEIYSKGRFKRERQENAIGGDKDWELGEGKTMKNAGVYKYESQVPLKKWMTVATLGIRRQIVGCACENDLADENVAQASLFENPQVIRRTPQYFLAEIGRKWDFGQDELEIVFKVSKTEIDSSVFNNEVTFGKILDAVDKIHSNPLYKIEKLHVAGYASLVDYIISHRPEYGLTKDNFEIHNGEENWEGLRRVVAESEIEEKDEILKLIDNKELSPSARKNEIRKLNGGKAWEHMLKEIYPHLRCARYLAVYYDSTDDKLVDIINKANGMIEEGRYEEAYDLVIGHKDDPRAANAIGVSLMMQKKFEEAMPWLEKAKEGGCEAAGKNVDSINAEYAHEEQQKKDIEEYLKKYE